MFLKTIKISIVAICTTFIILPFIPRIFGFYPSDLFELFVFSSCCLFWYFLFDKNDRLQKEYAEKERLKKVKMQKIMEEGKRREELELKKRNQAVLEEKRRKQIEQVKRQNHEDEIRRKKEEERARQRFIELQRRKEEKIKEEEKVRKEKEEKDRQANLLSFMKKSLPFYPSVKKRDGEFGNADNSRWSIIENSISKMDKTPTTLYLVKVLSLLDDKEYFKIGITTRTIEERFAKSTQLELIEIIENFLTIRYIALFAEYHFIREFDYTPDLVKSLNLTKPSVKFSGASEIVRPNSIKKISNLFSKLPEYEKDVLAQN